jgi:hypothetical protein
VQLSERRQLNNAAGDAITKAFELVLTPAIFGLVGYGIDRWLGTSPLFTLSLAIVVFLYQCWRLFSVYSDAMDRHAAAGNWSRQDRPVRPGEASDAPG